MAKLPNIGAAVVEDAKLTDYLLNAEHPRGRAKARFLAGYGFTLTALPILRDALLAHAAANEVSGERRSIDGTRYEIDGPLLACDGRAPVVRVVWYIRAGEDFPRLVTLIPRRIAGR